MTRSVLLALALVAGLLPIRVSAQAAAAPERPNVVLILADDLGYGDIGAYNPDSRVPTPELDRLAAQGVRFTDAHSSSAVCTPTRYALLTGRYAWRTRLKSGVLAGYSPLLIEPGRLTLASLLAGEGYATAAIGKWHLGLGRGEQTDYARPLSPGPNALGFDYFFGIPASLDMPPYVYVENEGLVAPPRDSIGASGMRRSGGDGFWRAGPVAPGFRHIDVLPTLAEHAVDWIERQAASERPFFLYLALSAPHTPWLPTAEFAGRSGAGPYGDFAAQVDQVVGRVLRALERTGEADETLVLFASDNGAHWTPSDIALYGHRANLGWRGQKADIHEAGHRVPFLVRWPEHTSAGAVRHETVDLADVMATLAEMVGEPLPDDAGEDSFSLLPLLLGRDPAGPVREASVHHSLDGMFALRQGPWKLVEGLGSGGFTPPRRVDPRPDGPAGQLYHLGDDPGETRDLYLERPDEVARLQALLDRYRDEGRSRPRVAGNPPRAGEIADASRDRTASRSATVRGADE